MEFLQERDDMVVTFFFSFSEDHCTVLQLPPSVSLFRDNASQKGVASQSQLGAALCLAVFIEWLPLAASLSQHAGRGGLGADEQNRSYGVLCKLSDKRN